jgi:hypothetical protein
MRNLAEARTYDGYRIPYGDKRFDLAVLSHVVEHLEHPRLLLYEASGWQSASSLKSRWNIPRGSGTIS